MEAIKDASKLYEVERRAEHAARPGFRITELQISKTQKVPWHYHSNVRDTFYVLKGNRPAAPPAPGHQWRRGFGDFPGAAGHRRVRFRPAGAKTGAMRPTMLRAGIALGLWLLAGSGVAADGVEKRYPLPERGALVVSVPAGWKDEVRQKDKALPPTIFFRAGQGKPQQVMVTPIRRARTDVPPFSKESVRQNVERGVEAVKAQALEKEIRLTEFQGRSGPGYYFEATDRAPKPGEYKYLRQGMLMADDLLVAFTVLTNDRQEQVMRDAMEMLKGASHAPE